MKNFEYFEKEIKSIIKSGADIGVYRKTGRPCDCDCINCNDCMLDVVGGTCEVLRADWLYEEHVEKPRISKRTKAFFDAIETGWVARSLNGSLYLYKNKPVKSLTNNWTFSDVKLCMQGHNVCFDFDFLTLDFIKWEDEEPWSVEDIRNLEVID